MSTSASVFWHLKIEDCANETMPRAECRRLHGVCAEVLEGVVADAQLAHHHECAGNDGSAAQLFYRQSMSMKASSGNMTTVVALLKRALACIRRCEESAAVQGLEMNVLMTLLTTCACRWDAHEGGGDSARGGGSEHMRISYQNLAGCACAHHRFPRFDLSPKLRLP